MTNETPSVDPENKGRAIYDEPDIGSGERSPGQHETEEMMRDIPGLPPLGEKTGDAPTQEDRKGHAPHGTPNGEREESGS